MRKKKSLGEKIVEGFDHLVHPDKTEEEKEVQPEEIPAEEVQPVSDYEQHPKFAKFQKG